jgi:hypothetical protein
VTAPGALDRILEALRAASREHRPIAIGWATVDRDRAVAEIAAELGTSSAAFLPAADSMVLGARCRVAYEVLPGGQPLAILEPATEGRLAALLARLGEGPAATWSRAVTAGPGPRSAVPGPFGFECLPPGGPAYGPFSLLIEDEPGTIDG